MIVVDASAVVDYLLDAGPRGAWTRATIRDEDDVAAPHLIDLEVVSSLRKLLRRRELPKPLAEFALENFQQLELNRYSSLPFLDRIWTLRGHLTPYDAAYVALSEELQIPLVTADARLARSAGHGAEIIAYPA